MAIQWWDGKILFVDGHIAMHPDCCCKIYKLTPCTVYYPAPDSCGFCGEDTPGGFQVTVTLTSECECIVATGDYAVSATVAASFSHTFNLIQAETSACQFADPLATKAGSVVLTYYKNETDCEGATCELVWLEAFSCSLTISTGPVFNVYLTLKNTDAGVGDCVPDILLSPPLPYVLSASPPGADCALPASAESSSAACSLDIRTNVPYVPAGVLYPWNKWAIAVAPMSGSIPRPECDGGDVIYTDTDLEAYVGSTVKIGGECYTVTRETGLPVVSVGAATEYDDCEECCDTL